ncbi:MAG TPA: hypothetical protein PKA55_06395 [Rhodoblastus sp.]|nr:hypothetical protein [Rhodoblastus sp.]
MEILDLGSEICRKAAALSMFGGRPNQSRSHKCLQQRRFPKIARVPAAFEPVELDTDQ